MTEQNGKKRTFLIAATLLCFFVLFLMYPENVLQSGRKAVDLCLNIVIPSLLPFFVLSRLILNSGAIRIISKIFKPMMKPVFNLPGSAAFPLFAGWLSGYPAGAKYTTDLYHKGLLSRKESERLLSFCNNSGPLFIVGAVGTGFFGNAKLGFTLLACHLLASATIGIGTGLISRVRIKEKISLTKSSMNKNRQDENGLSGQVLSEAIIDSMMALLQISATIIFFAVLVQALDNTGVFSFLGRIITMLTPLNHYGDAMKIIFAGSIEITYGLYLLSVSTAVPLHYKMLLTAFLCGFGGFSVHTQVIGLCPAEFRLKNYFSGKMLHGLIASVYTGLALMHHAVPVMSDPIDLLYHSIITGPQLYAYILFILLCIVLVIKRHHARHKRKI